MKKGAFYVHTNKEYEANIHEYRVLRKLTVSKLAKMIDSYPTVIANLANGTISPIYLGGKRKGELKPIPQKIIEALRANPEDIFPRYFCKIKQDIPLLNIQKNEICVSSYSTNNTNFTEQFEHKNFISYLFAKLGKREIDVLVERANGRTLDDIGKENKISRERARQIEKKAIFKINRAIRQMETYQSETT